ncbi:uncharacterized protein LOC34622840 [Cyclospora cayetanensis]|uniref:Uncharacterized protein LOC34622840 n=1 Tax=Cyclospora cayetanensis TaxID=88456 RepID=A0A6P6RZT3_9EIME|nr:uncharacterized protein LOC34622840 [Cyclospora cayetanensis]
MPQADLLGGSFLRPLAEQLLLRQQQLLQEEESERRGGVQTAESLRELVLRDERLRLQQQQHQYQPLRQQQQKDASPRATVRWKSADSASNLGKNVTPSPIVATPTSTTPADPSAAADAGSLLQSHVGRQYFPLDSASPRSLSARRAVASRGESTGAVAAGGLTSDASQTTTTAAAAAEAAISEGNNAAASSEAAALRPPRLRLPLGGERSFHDVSLDSDGWALWKEAIGWQLGLTPNSAELAERILRRKGSHPQQHSQQQQQQQQQRQRQEVPPGREALQTATFVEHQQSGRSLGGGGGDGSSEEEMRRCDLPAYRRQRVEEARRLLAALSPSRDSESSAAAASAAGAAAVAAAAAAVDRHREKASQFFAGGVAGGVAVSLAAAAGAAAAAAAAAALHANRRNATRESGNAMDGGLLQEVELSLAPPLGLPVQPQLVEVQERTPPPLGAPHLRRPFDLFKEFRRRQLEASSRQSRREAEGLCIVEATGSLPSPPITHSTLERVALEVYPFLCVFCCCAAAALFFLPPPEALLGPCRLPEAIRSPQTARRAVVTAAPAAAHFSPLHASDTEVFMRSRRRSRLFARRAAAAGEREVSVLPSRAQEAAAGAEPESRSISRAALLEDERRSTRGLPPPPKSRRSRLYRHPAQRWEAGGGPLPSLALPFQSSGHRDSPQQRLPQQQETGDSAETEAASSDGAVSYEGTPQSVRQQRQERQELRHRTHPEEARRRRQRGTLPAVSDSDESLDTSAVVTSGAAKGPPPHFEATACIRRSGVTAAAAGDPAEGAVVFLPSERRGKAQAETGGDSLESAAHVNLLDNKPQGPLSTGVLPPGAATSRLEDLAAQSAPSPAAESLTPPDASQTLGVFEEWREADDDGVPQLDAAAEEAWRSDAEAQTPPQQLQQGQLEEGDRDAEGDRDQQQLSAQKEASQPALEAARDEENPADTAVSTEDTDGRGYQTGSVTSPGGAARRLDTGALVIPPQPPHASDAAAAVAASEEVGETVSTPRAGGAQQQLVEVAVSPVRSVQRGIQTSPERAKPRQSLRNTRGASTRTRRGVPPTQLDRSSPPQLAPTPLRRYPQRTRLKPLLGWMGERIDYDWRGMVEVVRCSNILDLYLQARDVGALPDAALHTADPEKLIRRMLKQQQLVVASKEAKAALALEDQQQQRQHGLKAVEKAAESKCSWRGIGPGDAMQLAVVRQGRRLVSYGGYAEIYIACVLLDAPTD